MDTASQPHGDAPPLRAGQPLNFRVISRSADSRARAGVIRTPHGVIRTPVFMPVGTHATVKAVGPDDLEALGASIILSNTYHLLLRPGPELVARFGGLHGFMRWPHPILTDSGGFQVFSLATIRKIQAHGVEFRSHLDGSLLFLGPKEAMAIQRELGSDIAMVFDDCPAHTSTPRELRAAVERTVRWAKECREQPRSAGQMVFGIVQGGTDAALREQCARELVAADFDGYAVGGVSVGEPEPEMFRAIELTEPFLPARQPRYAMGLGTPAQLVELVARGIDMFDCVLPTRVARNGTAFTRRGSISIKGGAQKADFRPIEEDCDCFACRHFTRAYLRHLLNVGEILGLRMLSVHNTRMYLRVMEDIRAAIVGGTFEEFRRQFVAGYVPTQKVLLARAAAADR